MRWRRVEKVARGKREACSPWIGIKKENRAPKVPAESSACSSRASGARHIKLHLIQARRGLTAACTWLPSSRASGATP